MVHESLIGNLWKWRDMNEQDQDQYSVILRRLDLRRHNQSNVKVRICDSVLNTFVAPYQVDR